MRYICKLHPAWWVGWACLAWASTVPVTDAAAGVDAAVLLQQADRIKTADNSKFTQILRSLGENAQSLSSEQRMRLRYLKAWQDTYDGKYEAAIPQLNSVIEESKDPTLRFRAGVTVVNALAIATRYQEGYTRLSQLLDQLPQVSDREAREQGLVVAAILYNLAGQYELGLSYAERLLKESTSETAACKGGQLRLEALYRSGKLRTAGADFDGVIAICERLGEHIFANIIRSHLVRLHLADDRLDAAIELLDAHYAVVERTKYARLISEFDALLAEAYLRKGDSGQARQFALKAIRGSVRNEFTRPLVEAYRVLYVVARQQGNFQSAIEYHEKYAEADKGYLTEASGKALAYQAVRQEVQEKKGQIDALNKRNEVLQLQQKVSKSAAQTRGLYILLLLSVLAFIAMWLYKTKLSQLHFMKLARRDGLTGIFNRSHFADAAESILTYCKKGGREACVVLIDLDNFKLVNDDYGHAAGDTVLRRTVQACQSHLRSIDIIGRLGGEEFGIVLPDCDPDRALALAEQFRLGVLDMSSGDGSVGFPVSASFGVTSSRWSGYNLRQLIIHADKALYSAKKGGRNRVELFDFANADPIETATAPGVSFDRRRT